MQCTQENCTDKAIFETMVAVKTTGKEHRKVTRQTCAVHTLKDAHAYVQTPNKNMMWAVRTL